MGIIINGHYFRKKTSKRGLKISPIERITVLSISGDSAKVAKGHLANGEKSQYMFNMNIDKIIEVPTSDDYKLLLKEEKTRTKNKERRKKTKARKEKAIQRYLQRDKMLRDNLLDKGVIIPAICCFTNWELQNLRDNLDKYIPDLSVGGVIVKVLEYDSQFDRYLYVQA